MTTRLKEIVKKYGKVALGVHISVSGISISALYIAIKSSVDVESLFDKYHLPGFSTKEKPNPNPTSGEEGDGEGKNRTTELMTGGALGLAILCNKALFPIRVPITMAITPPVARFLARRKLIKSGV